MGRTLAALGFIFIWALVGVGETLLVVINEFGQGVAGNGEWVELLVVGTGPCPSVDLRGYRLLDREGFFGRSFPTRVVFRNVPAWTAIPAGTLIVIYNGAPGDAGNFPPGFPFNDLDFSDHRVSIPHTNADFFENVAWGGFGNGGDYVVLLDGTGAVVDSLSYGSLGEDPAREVHLPAVGANTAAWFTGGSTSHVNHSAFWQTGSESGGASTPGAPNGGANTAWRNSLLPRPTISVAPSSHGFGSVVVGQESPPLTVTVHNTGCAPLTVGTVTLIGSHPWEFEIRADNASGQTIAPSTSRTVQVVFKPTSPGDKSASLRIPSNDPASPVVMVSLSGTGVAPRIAVSPASHDFGAVVVGGESAPLTVTVRNEGSAPLTVGTVSLSGTHPGEFALRHDQVSGETIPAGEARTLQVVFRPTSAGAKSAFLEIPSNDPVDPVVWVSLVGTGQAALAASAGGPYSGVVGVDVTLQGSATGGFPPYTFAWDLDADGEYDDATGAEVHWTWTAPGIYVVRVQVTDSAGAQATASTTVRIYPAKGDVNGDGRVDLVDLRLAHQAALGLLVLSPEERDRADINGNGVVDMEDVTLICRMVLGGCG